MATNNAVNNIINGLLIAASPQQIKYVALNGNDTTGTGTLNNPYATISAAQTSITDASPTKRYIIQAAVGSFALPASFNPNIMFKGMGVQLTVFSGNTNINNANWNVNADNRAFFMDCSVTGILTFDCTTQVNNTQGKLYFYNVRTSTSMTPVFTALNAINQCIAQNCEFFSGFTVSGGTVNLLSCNNQGGTYTLNSNATVATTFIIKSGTNAGNYAVNFTAGHGGVTLRLDGPSCAPATTLALSGASANMVASMPQSLPAWANISYAGGASITNITALNGTLPPLVGQATLVAGTATVSTPHIKGSTSNVMATAQDGAIIGVIRCTAKTLSTSFVLTSTVGVDAGIVSYILYP